MVMFIEGDYQSSLDAVTNMPLSGGFNNKLGSHSSGGWDVQDQGASSVSGEVSFQGLQMTDCTCCFHKVESIKRRSNLYPVPAYRGVVASLGLYVHDQISFPKPSSPNTTPLGVRVSTQKLLRDAHLQFVAVIVKNVGENAGQRIPVLLVLLFIVANVETHAED